MMGNFFNSYLKPSIMALSFIASATSTTSTLTLPGSGNGVQAGDIAILFDHARNSDNSNLPTNVVPSGWTQLAAHSGTANSNGFRLTVSYKQLVSGDLAASITGMNDNQLRKVVLVVRPTKTPTAITYQSGSSDFTAGNPATNTQTPTAGTEPVISYGFMAAANAQSLTGGGTQISWNSGDAIIDYTIFNSGASAIGYDCGDSGNWNTLSAGIIQIA